MNSKEIVVSKKTAYIIALLLVILVAAIAFGGKRSILGVGQSDNLATSKLAAGSPEKFAVLSSHGTQGNIGST